MSLALAHFFAIVLLAQSLCFALKLLVECVGHSPSRLRIAVNLRVADRIWAMIGERVIKG